MTFTYLLEPSPSVRCFSLSLPKIRVSSHILEFLKSFVFRFSSFLSLFSVPVASSFWPGCQDFLAPVLLGCEGMRLCRTL